MPKRDTPLTRVELIGKANDWLEKAWRTGVSPKPTIDPDAFWAKALRRAPAQGETGGRSEEDIADFRLRLNRLCQALLEEAALNPIGLTLAHGQLVRAIRQRLRLGTLWLRKPETPTTPLPPPIIVIGHMRSGTTRLHRLFAADPAHSATRCCDSWNPVPARPDTRPFNMTMALLMARAINPWIDSIHPFGSTRPDEELGWLTAALHASTYESQWRIPGFSAFSEARDALPLYREFRRILATDAAHRGNAHLPRIMKVPAFTEDLPALLSQFPGARIVIAQRNRREVEASAISLVANQMAIQTDSADLDWIESECRRKITLRETRLAVALQTFDGPLVHMDFAELNENWEAAMKRAYASLGLRLTDTALQAMRAEQQKAAQGRLSHHSQCYGRFAQARRVA
ncbi:MAG: sulfotransferase [Sphingorhabdus sp.]